MLSVKNMKVGVRLGAAFALIILLLIVVSATATIKIGNINRTVDSMVSDRYLKVRLAFDVRDGVNDQIKFLRGMVLDAATPEKNAKRFGQLDSATQKTNAAIESIARLQSTEIGIKKIQEVKAAAQRFDQDKQTLIALIRAGNVAPATEYVLR
ncbi:MAG TPA: methyl-accepting chemotaxis protein, partial [Erwinia persicina]|nr:methyl-accepting chemotaxis protein [Erwinia persicina]